VEWVTKTDPENLWLADFMCHDFHSRGGNPFTSIAIGLGHAMSNSGSDTLNVIPASRYYYDFDENEVPVYSVNASEHSVTCTGIFFYEKKLKSGKLNHEILNYYSFDAPCEGSVDNPDYLAIAEYLNLRDWLKKFPKGILSVVSDTMDLWKVITHILPRLKQEILSRDGKLVIRPDSGDPVEIICGLDEVRMNAEGLVPDSPATKGVTELLWDLFGGEITSTGYKRLDSHIGAIYGDSINLERQIAIYTRSADKGFASTNVVLGIGSFTYQYNTRDTFGFAMKATYVEIIHPAESGSPASATEGREIFKDPITDDGTKKSATGLLCVEEHDGKIGLYDKVQWATEKTGLLQDIYLNGEFHNTTDLATIRQRVQSNI
jgi:nicotinamide phosphoribosyltransferase